MFFIFGSPRSGTTLLAQSLSQNDHIFIPNETDFIIPIAFIFDRIKDPYLGKALIAKVICNSERYTDSLSESLDHKAIQKIVTESNYNLYEILTNLYDCMAKANNSKIGGDKSPNDMSNFYMLLKANVFTEKTKIIHIIRDPRDVLLSLLKLGWVDNDDTNFPRVWSNINLNLYEYFSDMPDRYKSLRYEDLVSNYTSNLMNLCNFLEIEYQPKMADHTLRDPRYRDLEHHKKIYQPVTCSEIGKYKKNINKDVIYKWQKKAFEGLNMFGYDFYNEV